MKPELSYTPAPIGVSTYSRVEHLKRTIESLRESALAHRSSLYVFSDAPKPGDEGLVERVRDYVRSVDGFAEVVLVERETNSRTFNNRGGLKYLLDRYGKAIYIEEDVVAAPGFLAFMNSALEYYSDNLDVISITGYCPPIMVPERPGLDVFFLRRFSAWGFATWRGRFDPFELTVTKADFKEHLGNLIQLRDLMKNGDDMLPMLLEELDGDLDALDVKLMYHQFKCDKYTVYPRKSLTLNIGHDGSGLHCVETERFMVDLWEKQDSFEFSKELVLEDKVVKRNARFRSLGLRRKLRHLRRYANTLMKP